MNTQIAQFNRFEVELPIEAVEQCSGSGRMDENVEFWVNKAIFHRMTSKKLKQELSEYGAWDDEELNNFKQNLRRIVWIAACDLKENPEK